MKKLLLPALIISILGIAAIFSMNRDHSNTAGISDSASNTEIDPNAIQIEGNHLSFSKEEITASAGETLTIVFTSVDELHDFVIDELDVDSGVLGSGQSKTLTITIPENAEVGDTFTYYCSVGSHRAMGMEGKITIE